MWVGKCCYWADVSSALCSACSPALSFGLDRYVRPSPSCPNISWENNKWGEKQRADSVQPSNGQKWGAGQVLALTTLTQRKPSKRREVTNVWTVAAWRGKSLSSLKRFSFLRRRKNCVAGLSSTCSKGREKSSTVYIKWTHDIEDSEIAHDWGTIDQPKGNF